MREFGITPGRTVLVLLLALISLGAASAEVLTLDQSIDLALKNNFGVISARNDYLNSRTNVLTGWGGLLPSMSLSASTNRYFDFYGSNIGIHFSYGGLGVANYATIKNRYHVRNSQRYNFTSTQKSLVQQIKESYYNAVKAKMLVGVSEDGVKRSEEGLRVAQSRYDLGAASMSDVLKARVQLASDKLDLVTNRNSFNLALANLSSNMGVDVNREIDVVDSLPPTKFDISFNSALNEALANNPDYRKAQFDLETSRDRRLTAYSNLLPSLGIDITYGSSARSLSTALSRVLDLDKFRSNYGLGITLNFNIFNGFSDYASIKTSSRNVETAGRNYYNTGNTVALALKQAYLNLNRAGESKNLSDESVAAAQEDLNLVREKYALGAATILDVLTSEVSLKQALINQVQALFDYNIAVSQLEKAMGR